METPGALAGVKVLDLTRVLAGPLCTMLLGDMGAEIIKVESPGGDDTRSWGPPYAGGEAAYFLGVNRSKRSITLNLATAAARDILGQMIRQSDVLVENFKAGTLDRWGFGMAWRAAQAPRLVHCSITGYGATGPKAELPGYDFILQAESGLMSITGDEPGEPVKHGVAIVDVMTGLLAANGVLSALIARGDAGPGQTVGVSLYETALAMLVNVGSNHLVSGQPARRFGNGHPNIVPYRTFATADSQIALAVGNDAQFARFAALVGHPEWAADGRFATNAARVHNREAIDALAAGALSQRTTASWVQTLRADGIPCGGVNAVHEALDDPQALAREMVLTTQHPTAGALRMLGFPIKLSGTPMRISHPPPLLGQHTEEVLTQNLGLDQAAIAALRDSGAI